MTDAQDEIERLRAVCRSHWNELQHAHAATERMRWERENARKQADEAHHGMVDAETREHSLRVAIEGILRNEPQALMYIPEWWPVRDALRSLLRDVHHHPDREVNPR